MPGLVLLENTADGPGRENAGDHWLRTHWPPRGRGGECIRDENHCPRQRPDEPARLRRVPLGDGGGTVARLGRCLAALPVVSGNARVDERRATEVDEAH